MSSNKGVSAGLTASGLILMEATEPSHLATTMTAPPPLLASTVREARPAWVCSICCCMRAACFMSFPMLDIKLFDGVPRGCDGSGPYLDNLAFENFQGFLDQGIVFKVVLAGGGRGGW